MPVNYYNEHIETLMGLFRHMHEEGTGLVDAPQCGVYEKGRVTFFLTVEFTPMGRVALATLERATNVRYNYHPTPWVIKVVASDIPKSGIDIELEGNLDSVEPLIESIKQIVLNLGNQRWITSIDEILIQEGYYPEKGQPDQNPEAEEAEWEESGSGDEGYDPCQGCNDTTCPDHPDYEG